MAKVKNYTGKAAPVIVEDPRPEVAGLYFYGDRHDKSTLAPVFDTSINFNADGSYATVDTSAAPSNNKPKIGILMLSKQTTSVGSTIVSANNTDNPNVYDNAAAFSMDPSYQPGYIYKITNGTFTTVTSVWNHPTNNYVHWRGWPALTSNQQLSDTGASQGGGQIYGHLMNFTGTPLNGYLPGVMSYNGTNYFYPDYNWCALGPSWPSTYTSIYYTSTNLGSYYNVQYLGTSAVDQSPLYVTTYKGSTTSGVQIQVQKVRWTTSSPTVTQMFTNSTVPSASGTSAGGNNMNNKVHDKFCSNWFVDPRDVTNNTRCFYFPYWDTSFNYHPFVVTWNITNDTFTRETDISITAGGKSSTDQSVDISSLYSSSDAFSQCFAFNETFVLSGTRYVTAMFFDSREQYPNTTGPRTFITYSVNATNPKALTYHSKVTMPKTPKNLVWLNDTHTMMGVFMNGLFNIYMFNASSGWALTTSIAENVFSCGRDSLDRIWYVTASTKYASGPMDLHLLTPTLPVSIVISPELTSYSYSGSPLNSYINVSALNAAGTRIATSVKLVIQGSNMTFADSTTVKTVTTLTGGPLQVNTITTGAGFTNIIASVEV